MTSPERKPFLGAAALVSFFLAQACITHHFIQHETRPPGWDQANHMHVAWQYREALRRGDWSGLWRLEPKHYIPPFPPLYHLALTAAYATANPAGNALWVNWLYLLVLCCSIYAIGSRLGGDDRCAAAAIAFACAPVVQSLLHSQLIDLPLTACAAAAYWAWLRADRFRDRTGPLLFATAFAAGMLHKWSFFSYMLPVLYFAAAALRQRATRVNLILAALLSGALFMPWYAIRIPFLLQRLVQASADQAAPFWRHGAFFQYLLAMPQELGLLFSLCAAAALILSWRQERLRPVLMFLLCAYVFWAVVPNRQMRFLLPGLFGAALLIAAALPKKLVWTLACVQVLAAADRTFGWFGPFSLPAWPRPISAFPLEEPRREDWKLPEIVAAAAAAASRPGPVTVALVANDERFNNLNLLWTAAVTGKDVEFQAAYNKLWELADLVILKKGALGPPSVIQSLPAIEKAVLRPDGAFAKGFQERARWTLPDGSFAILFSRRQAVAKPFPGSTVRIPEWRTELSAMRGLKVRFGRWDPAAGVYDRVEVRPESAALRTLPLSRLQLTLEGALPLPEGKGSSPEGMRLLKLRRLRLVSASITASDLKDALESKGVKVSSLVCDGGVAIEGRYKGLPFSIEAGLEAIGSPARRLVVALRRLRIAGVPVPVRWASRAREGMILFEAVFSADRTVVRTDYWASLERSLPFAVELSGVSVRDGRIDLR